MPTVFDQGNSELATLVGSPTLENLLAYFDARTEEWCEPIKSMECFTVGVFYDLASAFQGSSAFELLDTASEISIDSMPDKKFARYIDLLADLAESSTTTEIPPNLERHWEGLIDRATKLEPTSIGLTSLRNHYRNVG